MSESELLAVLLFLCGLGDAVTTEVGLGLGYPERNPFFAPFLSTLMFLLVFVFLDWSLWDSVPEGWGCRIELLRVVLKGGLLLCALSPVLNNLLVLAGFRFV